MTIPSFAEISYLCPQIMKNKTINLIIYNMNIITTFISDYTVELILGIVILIAIAAFYWLLWRTASK